MIAQNTSTLLIILGPIGLFVIYLFYRLLVGRPLPRRSLNVGISLLLLVYFLLTTGLGIFWVARHELPVFDLHYLFGYVTLAFVLVHLALNWKLLTTFFRKAPGKGSGQESRRSRLGGRGLSWIVGFVLFGGFCFWLGLRQGSEKIEISIANSPVALPQSQPVDTVESGLASAVPARHQIIKDAGKERTLANYYHEKTKHSRLSLMREGKGLDWSSQPSVFKKYPDAEVVVLPEPRMSSGMSVGDSIKAGRRMVRGFIRDPISMQDLSTLLHMTNGVTGELRYPGINYYLRAAPSAGALYPTVTYIVIQNVEGLPAGLYHYNVREHKLHKLVIDENIGKELSKLIPESHVIESAPVTFIFTSIFFRSSWKYGKRSYRYSCLDAGHLAVQTMLAANAMGYGAKMIGRFDDTKVNAVLNVDDKQEGAMLIVSVGKIAEESPDIKGQAAFIPQTHKLDNKDSSLVMLMHGATYFGRTGEIVQHFAEREPINKSYSGLPMIRLPKEFEGGDDLYPTILRRRSARRWAKGGMTISQLSSVMYYVYGTDKSGALTFSDPSIEGNHALHLYLIVHDVKGLDPGVYYYQRSEHALTQIRKGDFRSESHAIALFQDVVGNCDVALVMTIDLKRYDYPDADRGYRYAAIDAGMLGGRLYLQTVGLGLGCCGIGAFFDDEVSQCIKVNPEEELVIYMAAIGTKAE